MLFADWLQAFLDEKYGVNGTGGTGASDSRTIRLNDGAEVVIERIDAGTLGCKFSDETRAGALDELAPEALRRAEADDLGGGAWFQAHLAGELGAGEVGVGGMGVQMIRVMGEERLHRGRFRIGPQIGLEFTAPDVAPGTPRGLASGTLELKLTLGVPGPSPGLFAQGLALEVGRVARTLATFVTGTAFKGPWAIFAATQDEAATSLSDAVELQYEGIELAAAVPPLAQPQTREALERLLGALYSYEEAITQRAASSAVILFVTALEALSVPNASWREERITTRFVKFLQELCPEAIAHVIAHDNFGQAFGAYTSPRRFLEQLYDMRSRPLHTGLVPRDFAEINEPRFEPQVQVALASELTRAAIGEFLKAPRSSLIGHAATAPSGA